MWLSLLLLVILPPIIIQNAICTKYLTSDIRIPESSAFVTNIVYKALKDCKFYLVFGKLKEPDVESSNLWQRTFEHISAHNNLQKYSGGATNLQVFGNQTEETQLLPTIRPTRMFSECCSVTILILPSIFGNQEEIILTEKLTMPLLNPLTYKNQDKFIILTRDENIPSLFQSKFIRSIKYKLILTDVDGRAEGHTFCPYCPQEQIQAEILNPNSVVHDPLKTSAYFPDLQKNYHGSSLKLSASDKVVVLLEIIKGADNKYFAKRGVYAAVLFHLMYKLNFTYDLVVSSGGGSTGHKLPNGTWVGTVGDAYNGRVDFGFMADVTYQRFSVVELCATINYAYLGFGTGPPAIIYTWRAIFWPFKGSMWGGMIASVFISTMLATLLLKNCFFRHQSNQNQPWDNMSIIQFYLKILIEQGEDCPNRSSSVRVFIGFWLLFAIVATTAYKSKIVSFMMFPVVDKVPHSFEDLAKSKFEIDFHYFGNVAYNLFKASTSPTFVTMYQRMKKEPDALKCLQRTMTAKSACILFGITYERLRYRNLSDRIGNSPVQFSPHYGFMYTPGVIHEKKAVFSSNFKNIIGTAMEMGLIGEWKQSDLNNILREKTASEQKSGGVSDADSEVTEDSDGDVLHLPNLIGSFAVLCIGISIGTAAFVGENIYSGHKNRYRRKLITSLKKS